MEIQITRFVHFENEGALQAFCDVLIGNIALIKGIRVVEGRNGPFVTMPRQQNKNNKWYDSVVVIDPHLRAEMSRLILEAYANRKFERSTFQTA